MNHHLVPAMDNGPGWNTDAPKLKSCFDEKFLTSLIEPVVELFHGGESTEVLKLTWSEVEPLVSEWTFVFFRGWMMDTAVVFVQDA